MAPDHFAVTPEDRALLDSLGDLVRAEAQMPPGVAQAATALHDWANADAVLADLVAEPVATRGDAVVHRYAAGEDALRAEVEPAGYRRRRVVVSADGANELTQVYAQRADGAAEEIPADRFGEYAVDLASGPVRLLAHSAGGASPPPGSRSEQ